MSVLNFQILEGSNCLFLQALGLLCGRIVVGEDCASTTIASVEEAFEWNNCLREVRRENSPEEIATLEMREKSAGLQKTREGLFTSIATYAYLGDLTPGKIELRFCRLSTCSLSSLVPHALIVCMGKEVSSTLVTLDALFKTVCRLVQTKVLSNDQGIALIAAGRQQNMVVSDVGLKLLLNNNVISERQWRLMVSNNMIGTLNWVSL